MNKNFLKKTAIGNIVLIACVGALHTVAVAAIMYQAPLNNFSELNAEAVKFDLMELEFFGDSRASVEEAHVEEIVEFVHPPITEAVQEHQTIAVKSAEPAELVEPVLQEPIKPKQIPEQVQKKIEPPKVKPEQVKVKPKVELTTQTVAKHAAKQQLQGGKPMVSSSSIHFIKNPAPKRPRIAQRNQWTGNSVVILEIDARGYPIKVSLERSSGHEVLDKAALEAAQNVKIHPYIENGQTIAIRHRIDYAF